MLLKSILVGILVPPMDLLYLAAAGLVILRWRPLAGRLLAGAALAAMLLLSVPAVSYALLGTLEQDLPVVPPADDMPGAIVILAGDAMHTSGPRNSQPGYLTLDRLRTGAALHRRTALPLLVTGGTIEPGDTPLAAVMAESLRTDFQVPVAWLEGRSLDTWQNATFSAEILKRNNIRSVYVVTQAWHLRRALLAFRKAGLTATAAPRLDRPERGNHGLGMSCRGSARGKTAITHFTNGSAVPGMRSADPATQVEAFESLDSLPAGTAPLLDGASNFFATRAWWETVLAHAMPAGTIPRLVLVRAGGAAKALFPMIYDPADGEFRSLTTAYSCLYEPLFAHGVTDRTPLIAAFARYCRPYATTRLDALDQDSEAEIVRGARQAGLVAAQFQHFGNWHEDIAGVDWGGYLARRPGALRETIRRRTRRADRLEGARYRLFDSPDDLDSGIDAFETIYARSWKEPEPFPAINPAQIRAAARLGIMRLGVWWIDGTPAAAQFWIVEHGRATVLKLAHDETFKANSPGTVLTAWLIRHMIEKEHATELDFGRGDDPYKRDWAASRRQRTGLLLINPRRPAGAIALARHIAGRVRTRLRGPAV